MKRPEKTWRNWKKPGVAPPNRARRMGDDFESSALGFNKREIPRLRVTFSIHCITRTPPATAHGTLTVYIWFPGQVCPLLSLTLSCVISISQTSFGHWRICPNCSLPYARPSAIATALLSKNQMKKKKKAVSEFHKCNFNPHSPSQPISSNKPLNWQKRSLSNLAIEQCDSCNL